MNQNEIENHIEGLIESLMEEGGLEREEVLDAALMNCLWQYDYDEISREDLVSMAKYLEADIDIDLIDEVKASHQKQRAYRKARRASK